jgi:hypothetical protein
MRFFATTRVDETATLFVGGSNTVGRAGPVGFYYDYLAWLLHYMADTTTSLAVGGTDSWYAAIRIADIVTAAPTHIVIEYAINDSVYFGANGSDRENGWQTVAEALIVRLRTVLPDAKLIFINLSDPLDADVYADSGDLWEALCAKHGIAHHRLWDYLTELLGHEPTQEEHDLYHDGVHLTDLGQHTAFDMIEPSMSGYYPNPNPGWSGDLADYQPYYFDDLADWLHDPILRNGVDNDGETGTGWSTSGTARQSATADDTIRWTGTFCSFALDTPAAVCTLAWSIDGGAYTNRNQTDTSPTIMELFATDYGEHTVTVKVVSGTVKINRFLAV